MKVIQAFYNETEQCCPGHRYSLSYSLVSQKPNSDVAVPLYIHQAISIEHSNVPSGTGSGVCVCVCVCVCERERETEKEKEKEWVRAHVCVCMHECYVYTVMSVMFSHS